jgi:hypothetical protein
LAGYINFKALGDEPFAFTPNDSREAALHHIAPPLKEIPSLKLPKPSGIITAASKCRRNYRKLTVSATRRRRDLYRPTSLIRSTALLIRLTEERWRHIVIEHPELRGYRADWLATVKASLPTSHDGSKGGR